MKYKVGDKVRVRRDLVLWKQYCGRSFTDTMSILSGKKVIIEKSNEGIYRLVEDEDKYAWTDEMLEDVEEEFKLPEKWCIKATKENIGILGDYWDKGCGLREVYSHEDTIRNDVGKYWCSYNLASGNLLFSISPGSNHIIDSKPKGLLEITFDQFKKYVLKESEPTPVKDDVKFEVGKWYKYSAEYIHHKTYAKYSSNQSVGGRFYYDEIITENSGFKKGHNWSILTCKPVLLTDLSEIQQYLPENHPDKIKKRTKKVEDLKYPDVVHCVSKEEHYKVKQFANIGDYNGNCYYLLDAKSWRKEPWTGTCASNLESRTTYTNYEFSDIIFPEEKGETKPILSKKELLAEAKRRYPVGTKYKTASDDSSNIFVLSSDDWSNSLLDDVVYAEYGKGCLYYKGDWAEIISKPTVEKHPKYVECIGLKEVDASFWSHNFAVGEIYLVEEDNETTSFRINGAWCDKSQFKPSTKEAFDKQSKSGVKEKEELVQTEMSQRQACNSCKYHDNCGTKGFFCNASGGQHYPKYNSSERYIVAADPFDAESSSSVTESGKFPHVHDDVFKRMNEMNMIRMASKLPSMGWIYNPYNQADCKLETIDSDEIYVPIIKTEVKQIKL